LKLYGKELPLNRLLPLDAVSVRLAARPDEVISIAPLAVRLITDEPPTVTLNVAFVLTANPAEPMDRNKSPARENPFVAVPNNSAPLASISKYVLPGVAVLPLDPALMVLLLVAPEIGTVVEILPSVPI